MYMFWKQKRSWKAVRSVHMFCRDFTLLRVKLMPFTTLTNPHLYNLHADAFSTYLNPVTHSCPQVCSADLFGMSHKEPGTALTGLRGQSSVSAPVQSCEPGHVTTSKPIQSPETLISRLFWSQLTYGCKSRVTWMASWQGFLAKLPAFWSFITW